jgi:hypothetical protein
MVESLTNVILASILYLIRRDLNGNGRVPLRRAPLRWVTPRRASARWRRRRPHRSRPDDTTPIVPAHGTITTKSTRAVAAQVATATVRCTLHLKDTSRPWVVGRKFTII